MLRLLELILPTRLVKGVSREQKLTDSKVQKNYLMAGERFGALVYLRPQGEEPKFYEHMNEYVRWEREYSNRGFRTVPLLRFVQGDSVHGLLGIKRKPGEVPTLHGENYKRLWDEGKLTEPHGVEELKAIGYYKS